jgi:hypothetical protein
MKKLIALALIQIAILGGIILNINPAIANPLTPDRDNLQRALVDNGTETRSVPEQAKNAIDKGLSVFKQATENSLEQLDPNKTPSRDSEKFYELQDGLKAVDRDGGR